MKTQLHVESAGSHILARITGEPTADILKECQAQVLAIATREGQTRVLYDALQMTPPPMGVAEVQRSLDQALGASPLRRAVLVPNGWLAYMARLAFADADYRLFENDRDAAIRWLTQ